MSWIDELERDLGQAAALRLIANAGGQRRHIPSPPRIEGSRIEREVGTEIATWLAGRYGGDVVQVPSHHGRTSRERASRLRADVLDAGLINPTVSADILAMRYGVTVRRIEQVRQELRSEGAHRPLPLFDAAEALRSKTRR